MLKPLIEGEDFYFNEQGLMVLTEAFHLKRGYCCGNDCKHCPFIGTQKHYTVVNKKS